MTNNLITRSLVLFIAAVFFLVSTPSKATEEIQESTLEQTINTSTGANTSPKPPEQTMDRPTTKYIIKTYVPKLYDYILENYFTGGSVNGITIESVIKNNCQAYKLTIPYSEYNCEDQGYSFEVGLDLVVNVNKDGTTLDIGTRINRLDPITGHETSIYFFDHDTDCRYEVFSNPDGVFYDMPLEYENHNSHPPALSLYRQGPGFQDAALAQCFKVFSEIINRLELYN